MTSEQKLFECLMLKALPALADGALIAERADTSKQNEGAHSRLEQLSRFQIGSLCPSAWSITS